MMNNLIILGIKALTMQKKMIWKMIQKAVHINVHMTTSMATVIITEQDLDGLVVTENTVSAKPHTSNTL